MPMAFLQGLVSRENNSGSNVNITNALISEIGIREAWAILGSIRTAN